MANVWQIASRWPVIIVAYGCLQQWIRDAINALPILNKYIFDKGFVIR